MRDRTAESSQRTYARLAGFMYLFVLGFDIAGLVIVTLVGGDGNFVETSHRIIASETLYRVGLCCSLVGSLSTILLALSLYVAVRPVNLNLALMALLFRVAESATGALGVAIAFATLRVHAQVNAASGFDVTQLGALADLTSHGLGTAVSAIFALFFSLGSTLFFSLFLTANYIPRILSAWGVFASLVYATLWLVVLILPQYAATTSVYGSLPILIAEVSTGAWLVAVGIKTKHHVSSPMPPAL